MEDARRFVQPHALLSSILRLWQCDQQTDMHTDRPWEPARLTDRKHAALQHDRSAFTDRSAIGFHAKTHVLSVVSMPLRSSIKCVTQSLPAVSRDVSVRGRTLLPCTCLPVTFSPDLMPAPPVARNMRDARAMPP